MNDMKANEYIKKYKPRIIFTKNDEEWAKVMKELFIELLVETYEIKAARHISTDAGFFALLKEFNDKANRITRGLPENKGCRSDWYAYFFAQMIFCDPKWIIEGR